MIRYDPSYLNNSQTRPAKKTPQRKIKKVIFFFLTPLPKRRCFLSCWFVFFYFIYIALFHKWLKRCVSLLFGTLYLDTNLDLEIHLTFFMIKITKTHTSSVAVRTFWGLISFNHICCIQPLPVTPSSCSATPSCGRNVNLVVSSHRLFSFTDPRDEHRRGHCTVGVQRQERGEDHERGSKLHIHPL